MNDRFNFGFRILGHTSGERRRLDDWNTAYIAYANLDIKAKVEQEAYLSAFTFAEDFREYLTRMGTTKGFDGPCWSPWIWFDIDREEANGGIEAALKDARILVVALAHGFAIGDDNLIVFYSGCKGFHLGLPTAGFSPEPGLMFHKIARRFAENVASAAGVVIDTGVYDKVRAFRAPNSRHPKTGRHKHRLTVDELLHLSAERIIEIAAKPEPFDVPDGGKCGFELPAAWSAAAEQVRKESEAQAERRSAIANGSTLPTLNRLTFDFIREGAGVGDRHRLLYSCARNLGELGCPSALAHALLTEAALDSGLPPAEVYRQIECGLADAAKGGAT